MKRLKRETRKMLSILLIGGMLCSGFLPRQDANATKKPKLNQNIVSLYGNGDYCSSDYMFSGTNKKYRIVVSGASNNSTTAGVSVYVKEPNNSGQICIYKDTLSQQAATIYNLGNQVRVYYSNRNGKTCAKCTNVLRT